MAMTEMEISEFLSRLKEEPGAQVRRVRFPDLTSQTGSGMKISLRYLDDVPVDLYAELGEKVIRVGEFLNLREGMILELNKPAGETVVLKVNGLPFARGEVIVISDSFAVRLHNIARPRVYEADDVL